MNDKKNFRKQAKRFLKQAMLTLTAGMIGAALTGAVPEVIQETVQNRKEQAAVTAWWGTLYPKFCFSRFPSDDKVQKDDIKISFWLAQALNW